MVLLAAFKSLLHRYSGAVDVLVGTPVEGRLTADVEQVVGLFINTLVMRTDLSGDPAFSTLLARVRDTTLDAQAHQEVPFEQLVEALAPERSLSRSPVFQVMFNLVQLPERSRRAGDLELRVDRLIDQGVSSFDLTLTAAADDQRPCADLRVRHRSLRRGDDRAAGGRLPVPPGGRAPRSGLPAVAAAAAGCGRAPADPRPGAVARVNGAGARRCTGPWPPVARRSAGAVAVELDGDTLTYAELEARANRLARHLLGLGLGRGARVGICLPRTPDYLVAVLAVLKAGAAYVPLDPAYPAERLAGMAADAELVGAGRQCGHARRARRCAAGRVDLDADEAAIAGQAAADPAVARAAGRSRLRAVHLGIHRAAQGRGGHPRATWPPRSRRWRSAYGLQAGEAHLQMASAAFDVFTGDWVRALGTGGRLVLCPRDVLLDPPALLALLRAARIRVAEFVPAIIRLLLGHCRATGERLPALRLLIVGSDTWHGSELAALRAWRRRAPG